MWYMVRHERCRNARDARLIKIPHLRRHVWQQVDLTSELSFVFVNLFVVTLAPTKTLQHELSTCFRA